MRATPLAALAALLSALSPPAAAQDTHPSHRVGSAIAYDVQRGTIVLFGGMLVSDRTPAGDTWEFDGTSWHRVEVAEAPAARAFAAMAWHPLEERLILHGGASEQAQMDDTWAWDGDAWTRLSREGPGARMMGTLLYEPRGQRMLLVGGMNPTTQTPHNDVWAFDGTTWTRLDEGPAYAGLAPGEATRRRAYEAAMKSDLRNVATAQEVFFADHSRYATALDDLGDFFTASPGVTITVVSGGPRGWSAYATIESLPGARCAMYVGDTDPVIPGEEGAVICEGTDGG